MSLILIPPTLPQGGRRSPPEQLVECVKAVALCHNVTPVVEGKGGNGEGGGVDEEEEKVETEEEVVIFTQETPSESRMSYQASSPDEAGFLRIVEQLITSLLSLSPLGKHVLLVFLYPLHHRLP